MRRQRRRRRSRSESARRTSLASRRGALAFCEQRGWARRSSLRREEGCSRRVEAILRTEAASRVRRSGGARRGEVGERGTRPASAHRQHTYEGHKWARYSESRKLRRSTNHAKRPQGPRKASGFTGAKITATEQGGKEQGANAGATSRLYLRALGFCRPYPERAPGPGTVTVTRGPGPSRPQLRAIALRRAAEP